MNDYEKFAEAYHRNAKRMDRLIALYEVAMSRGDKKLARKYRMEYTTLKAEVDMYAIKIILDKERSEHDEKR